jgi:DNA-binding Lrp family transcriptional regulator
MAHRKAYVLIQVHTGKAEAVASALTGRPGIISADLVAGPHDVIAVLQGSDADSIARIVINEIQAVKGIQHTITYMVIND